MYRERLFFKVEDFAGWNEMNKVHQEINSLMESKGLAPGTLWTQSWGPFNELCIEIDYPDLATYEKERSMVTSDPDFLPLFERISKVTVTGWGRNEMWESATTVGPE